jgi:tRNA (cmo5U34)-methyltransferase
MTSAADTFQRAAADYDAARRRLIPPFESFYGTAVSALELAGGPMRRILDLGAGTGLLSQRVAQAHPQAHLTLLDGAPAMLEQARARVGAGAALMAGDLVDPLPAGPWDAVVSALAIHHLADEAKRELFARIHAALRPGGVFVNAEQVAGPTPIFDQRYRRWHAEMAAMLGASAEEWNAAQERMRLDQCTDVESQLTWLRGAGFADVDCLFRDHGFAVIVAVRAGD